MVPIHWAGIVAISLTCLALSAGAYSKWEEKNGVTDLNTTWWTRLWKFLVLWGGSTVVVIAIVSLLLELGP